MRQATLRAIRCTTTPMDLVCVQLSGGRSLLSNFLPGDKMSELHFQHLLFPVCRLGLHLGRGHREREAALDGGHQVPCLGQDLAEREFRFSLWSAYALANLKLYRGRLSYLQVF